MSIFWLFLIFFIISTLFSMIGMGGGILYVPILLFAGYSITVAPSISLILITATSITALYRFSKSKKVDWKLALVIDPPTDIMAFIGGYFSGIIAKNVLVGILICILFIAGFMMIKNKRVKKSAIEEKITKRWFLWHRDFNGEKYVVNLPIVLTATGLIGLLSGMLGITGGIIKLPIMVLLCGVPMDIAVATSTAMVAVTAISGLLGHAINGHVDWEVGLLLAIAAVAGGFIGSRISLKLDKSKLKVIFGVVILLVAVRLLIKFFVQ